MTAVDPGSALARQSTKSLLKHIRAQLQNGSTDVDLAEKSIDVTELLQSIRRKLNPAPSVQVESPAPRPVARDCSQLILRVDAALENAANAHAQLGKLNPRPPGFLNRAIQLVKNVMRRSLAWYTRPLHAFEAAILRSLQDIAAVLRRNDAELRAQAMVLEELRRQNQIITQELDCLRAAHAANPETADKATRP